MQLLLGKTASAVLAQDARVPRASLRATRPGVPASDVVAGLAPLRASRAVSRAVPRRAVAPIVAAAAAKLEKLTVAPVKVIEGHVKLPGSKSLSNRILLLAALAEGTTTVENILVSPSTTKIADSTSLIS